mgnify:CR=1 FL=1
MTDSKVELTKILEDAANGEPGAVAAFFMRLLISGVYVPLHPSVERTTDNGAQPILGSESFRALNYMTVLHDGKEIMPIFSEEIFVGEWAEREFEYAEVKFSSLIELLGDDVALHLNPGQDVGKEITPWEIAELRKGSDAIPDLVQLLAEEDGGGEIEVRSSGEIFPDLQRGLLPVLELYTELREAFIVAVKEPAAESERPAIGLRFLGITEGKRRYLVSELENAAKEQLPSHLSLIVCDDLDDHRSPHLGLFTDVTPFYIAATEPPATSPVKRLFAGLKGLGKSKG